MVGGWGSGRVGVLWGGMVGFNLMNEGVAVSLRVCSIGLLVGREGVLFLLLNSTVGGTP